jgi:Alpha-tubulin suppressor and related RCC1 domain-containing proteins
MFKSLHLSFHKSRRLFFAIFTIALISSSFVYINIKPARAAGTITITSALPNRGSSSGGTLVSITGSNFSPTTTVQFDGTPAVTTFVSVYRLTAITPPHVKGPSNITVSDGPETDIITSGFTFNDPPTISSISPASGIVSGGTDVTITGTDLRLQDVHVIKVVAGQSHSMALDDQGNLYIWGDDEDGQIGDGDNTANHATCESNSYQLDCVKAPIRLNGLDTGPYTNAITKDTIIVDISAGQSHSMALDDQGNLYIWGSDRYGNLGDGNNTLNHSTCGIMDEDCIKAPIKLNGLSAGSFTNAISASTKISKLVPSFLHSAAIDDQGNLYMWGNDEYGQIGDGSSTTNHDGNNVLAPIKLNGLSSGYTNAISASTKIVNANAGGYHSMAIDDQGGLYMWGYDGQTQIGDGNSSTNHSGSNVLAPIKLNGLSSGYTNAISASTKIVDIAAGGYHSMAIDDQGGLYMWGLDAYGQIGDGNRTTNHVGTYYVIAPIKLNGVNSGFTNAIATDTIITSIVAGGYYSAALDDHGNAYTWGWNALGQIGDGSSSLNHAVCDTDSDCVLAPIKLNGLDTGTFTNPISAATKIAYISAIDASTLALDDHGNVYFWGISSYGSSGTGSSTTNQVTFYTSAAPRYKIVAPVNVSTLDTSALDPPFHNALFEKLPLSVTFDASNGPAPCTNVKLINSTSITCKTSSHVAGIVGVQVDDGINITSLHNSFEYVQMSASTISPTQDSTTGGATVTIKGAFNISAATTTVSFDGILATNVAIINATTITVTAPAHSVGIVNVTVVQDGQAIVLANAFEYTAHLAPLSPNTGLSTDTVDVSERPHLSLAFVASVLICTSVVGVKSIRKRRIR